MPRICHRSGAPAGPDVCSPAGQRSSVSNKIIQMAASRRRAASALDEFLPELDLRRATPHAHIDPREIHLEPVGFHLQPAEQPLGSIGVESSKHAQFWPILAAALVGIGVTILAFVAFSRFAV